MRPETHTPGPWRYEPGTKTIRAVPSNYWLASMNSWDGAVNHEANATLIAAAPELLAALKWAMGKLPDDTSATYAAAIETIWKAEGRTNG